MRPERRPPWLKAQEHASLAEARTRAFLLDRFWILERSVDVEGADFIIQRRLTNRSLLDRDPPRLGFVQTKFYQDPSTPQYVHREYVVDAGGQPRSEFFLICHTGREHSAATYFLTAADIVQTFPLTPSDHSRPDRFALPGSKVLVQRFQVLDSVRILSAMETALHNADFAANRRFLSWALLSLSGESPPIDPIYSEELDNRWGDIPREFNKLRKEAKSTYWDLQEAADHLGAIIDATDPEAALLAAEALKAGYGSSIRLPDHLFDDEFLSTVRSHKQRYLLLQEYGLLNTHAKFRRQTIQRFISDVAPLMPMPRDRAYTLTTLYDADSLVIYQQTCRVVPASEVEPDPEDPWHFRLNYGVHLSEPGRIEAYAIPGVFGYDRFEDGKYLPDPRPWEDKLQGIAGGFVLEVCERLLELRFPQLIE
jgi:hypothetical protein